MVCQVNGVILPFVEILWLPFFFERDFLVEDDTPYAAKLVVTAVIVVTFLQVEVHVLVEHFYNPQLYGFQGYRRERNKHVALCRGEGAFADECHCRFGGLETHVEGGIRLELFTRGVFDTFEYIDLNDALHLIPLVGIHADDVAFHVEIHAVDAVDRD